MKAYERLLQYVKYETASDPKADVIPSNPKEWDFARALAEEMKSLGLVDIDVDEHCYVYGRIPANIPDYAGPVLGLIAHMDVSDAAPAENIKAQIIHYEGGDLVQNAETGDVISAADYPFLENYIGCDIITSDGSTLLGADNKAGIAEILTLAEILKEDPSIRHGDIAVGFTPDEEIGESSTFFDIEKFGADIAYTVDGDAFGECNYESFNAFSAEVRIKGFNIHPGSAKGKMINAARIAAEFERMLPDSETPEHTEGYEGFYHLCSITGDVESAELEYIVRDHDRTIAQKRCEHLQQTAAYLNAQYGPDTVTVTISESYRNMREVMDQHPDLVRIPCEIMQEMGVTPDTSPIRGGTDGAFLSFRGLPCPNLGVGGHNFHGRKEFAVLQDMDRTVELLRRLAERIAAE